MRKEHVDFVNIEVNIFVRSENKAAVKKAIEQLAFWEAIGSYEKTDILKRIDEVS